MGKHLVLLDSYKNVLFHNKIVRFIRKLVIQYEQILYNLYADSCGFMWILRPHMMMVPASKVEGGWFLGLRVGFSWLDGMAWMLPAHSGEGWKADGSGSIPSTATPRHGHRVERWKADGSPSRTAVPWPW